MMAPADLGENSLSLGDLKVIILGDYGIGKTCLIRRYIEGKFTKNEPTIGAAFFLKQWGKHNVAVWDTAGDERFTGLSSFYCRHAGAAILAFDPQRSTSFESLWARFTPLLFAANENCLRVVVGTKTDSLNEQNREVTIDEAINFARETNENIDCSKLPKDPYFETSSLTGRGVDNLFEYIFQYALPLSKEEKNTMKSESTVDLYEKTSPKKGCCR